MSSTLHVSVTASGGSVEFDAPGYRVEVGPEGRLVPVTNEGAAMNVGRDEAFFVAGTLCQSLLMGGYTVVHPFGTARPEEVEG